MKPSVLRKTVNLGQKLQCVFVATADSAGRPHLAIAGRIELLSEQSVAVEAWFCPGTVINLGQNPHVSLVVWDALSDDGYQLIGDVKQVEEQSFLNGYIPTEERAHPSPQVERRLVVQVDKVIDFSRAPHSDLEE